MAGMKFGNEPFTRGTLEHQLWRECDEAIRELYRVREQVGLNMDRGQMMRVHAHLRGAVDEIERALRSGGYGRTKGGGSLEEERTRRIRQAKVQPRSRG